MASPGETVGEPQRMCVGCGQIIPMRFTACPHCGKFYGNVQDAQAHTVQQPTQPAEPMRTCMGCGVQVPLRFNVCPYCGKGRA